MNAVRFFHSKWKAGGTERLYENIKNHPFDENSDDGYSDIDHVDGLQSFKYITKHEVRRVSAYGRSKVTYTEFWTTEVRLHPGYAGIEMRGDARQMMLLARKMGIHSGGTIVSPISVDLGKFTSYIMEEYGVSRVAVESVLMSDVMCASDAKGKVLVESQLAQGNALVRAKQFLNDCPFTIQRVRFAISGVRRLMRFDVGCGAVVRAHAPSVLEDLPLNKIRIGLSKTLSV